MKVSGHVQRKKIDHIETSFMIIQTVILLTLSGFLFHKSLKKILFISFILDFGVGKDVNRWIKLCKSNDFVTVTLPIVIRFQFCHFNTSLVTLSIALLWFSSTIVSKFTKTLFQID